MTTSATRAVRHFAMLDSSAAERLFHLPPEPIDLDGAKDALATALGATLYVPANRSDLAGAVHRVGRDGATSVVIDLEDAIRDEEVGPSTAAVVSALRTLAVDGCAPMVFVRVRRPGDVDAITGALGRGREALTGFVIPKFTAQAGPAYLDRIVASRDPGRAPLYAMPIIESRRVLYEETRHAELAAVAHVLAEYRDRVLAVRIGATDLSGALGIRRDPDLTIYDVHPVASVIASVVTTLGRCDGSGFVVTGPVWEYYNAHERMFRPLLRNTPFREIDAVPFRSHLVSRDLDGLLRELVLDRANGLQGKTVIPPSHVPVVHAMGAVTHEEFVDALAVLGLSERTAEGTVPGYRDVLGVDAGGVSASSYRNKMNESRPHRNWAARTLTRAAVFGVMRPDITVIELLTAVVDP